MILNSTERWYAIIGLGLTVWLVPFVFDLAMLPLQVLSYLASRVVYGTLLAGCAGVCCWILLGHSLRRSRMEALSVGGIWLLMALMLDFPTRWFINAPRTDLIGYGLFFALPLLAIPLASVICGLIYGARQSNQKLEHVAPIPRYLRKH